MSSRRLFKNPWWVVFGSVLGLTVSDGPVVLFTLGVFLKPVSSEFGWNRGSMTSALAISHAVNALANPFVGRLLDRWGVRRVTLPFVVLFSMSVAALSLTSANPHVFLLLMCIVGLTGSVQGPPPYAKAVSEWFDARRGLALGVSLSGIGLGTALMPQLAHQLIVRFGWRGAYIGLGLLSLAVAFPAVALFVRDPDGLLVNEREMPPGSSAAEAGEVGEVAETKAIPGLSLGEAVTSASFWFIFAAVFLVAVAVNGTIAHIVPILTDRGMSALFATSVLSAVGVSLIAGRFLSGYLIDRFFAPYVAAGFFLVPLAGILLLRIGSAGFVPLLGCICIGLGLGADVDLMAFLVGRYFGLRSFGAIYGFMMGVFLLGSGLGPWLMGVCFDSTHSYNLTLAGFALVLAIAAMLICRLGPYRYRPAHVERP